MTKLYDAIKELPPVYREDWSEDQVEDFRRKIGDEETLKPLCELLRDQPKLVQLLRVVFGASSYLTLLIQRRPADFQHMLETDVEDYCEAISDDLFTTIGEAADDVAAMAVLRRFKSRAALFLALMDIAGLWPIQDNIERLSWSADQALQAGVRYLLSKADDKGDYIAADPKAPERGSGYIVLGLGKLGAKELNYSSDIDLIVFYEPYPDRFKPGVDISQFFVRLTRTLVKLMQESTGDGYVFRTDLRLRPDPGATQVALSTEAGLQYYEAFGQNWERAALIKARPVAGDIEAGESFLTELGPFIWRKYLDFAAIADVHAMKRQIHAVKGHGTIAVRGHNIKLGRGGIREIEFFVQTQQLIAGGRQEELRSRGTLEGLKRLANLGWIDEGIVGELKEAYFFLRHVEHRLQMIADEQTHTLPDDDEALKRVARFSGFVDFDSFAQTLSDHLERVQAHYGGLFEDVPELTLESGNLVFTGDEEDPGTVETLKRMGFPNPSLVIECVKKWHVGRYPATRSERARERLTELQPKLLEALASTVRPDQALVAFDRFLKELPAGIQLFSLLRNTPRMLSLIADIMGTAPRLAGLLSKRARLVDAVLDPGFFGDVPDEAVLRDMISQDLAECSDYQDCLDQARARGLEQGFLIGVRVLSGTISAHKAGRAYAVLAECLVDALKERVKAEMFGAYGEVPGGECVVLAMGKLGGREMTAASDLDLIVLYDLPDKDVQSDGPKPLFGSQYYTRLTQRLISALTAPTAQGTLYEVDMRLRPSGNAGPVATRVEGFVDYQRNQAWTWEHMALTRARVVSGSEGMREKINQAIQDVLCMKRDVPAVAHAIVEMRKKISDAHVARTMWDIKHVRGGLVDLEFVTQFLQLVHAHEYPQILDQNTTKALSKFKEAGIIRDEVCDGLLKAADLFHSLTQILRLCIDGPFKPDEANEGLKGLLAAASGEPDFSRLEIRLAETEHDVAAYYDELILATSLAHSHQAAPSA